MKRVSQQDVVFPKLRPRHEYQEEPDLEAEKNKSDGQKTVHWHYGDFWVQNHRDTEKSRVKNSLIRLFSVSLCLCGSCRPRVSRVPYCEAALISLIRAA